MNEPSGNTEEANAFLETFRGSVPLRHEPSSHSHRQPSVQPSVEDEVENEEEEEASSHQGSQHSEELPEVAECRHSREGSPAAETGSPFSRAEAVYFRSCYNTV